MSLKPPPGLSVMEEIKWRQQQKAKQQTEAVGTANNNSSADKGPAAAGGNKDAPKPFKPPPPPGRKTEIQGGGAAAGGGGLPKPPAKPLGPPPSAAGGAKPDAKSENSSEAKSGEASPPKKTNTLASRQAMLANILGGGGGGGGPGGPPKKDAAPAPKKDGPKPVKKWATVDTNGDGSSSGDGKAALGAGSVKLEMPTDLSKYEKMAKMLPQGAVENAMVRDGFDPGYLFENCVTMKSDKKPLKSGGGGGTAPAAAAAAPTPAAPAAPAMATPGFPAQAAPMQQQQPQMVGGYGQPAPMAPAAGTPGGYGYAPPPPVPGGHFQVGGGYGQMSPWVQQFSPEYNAYYYKNLQTGEMSWNYPPMGVRQTFVAMMVYPFVPSGLNPEEMMVYENEQIEVYDVGPDGWVQCRCLRTGVVGLVPKNYTNIQ